MVKRGFDSIKEIKDIQYLIGVGRDISKEKINKNKNNIPATFYLYLLGQKINIQKSKILVSNATGLRNSLMFLFMKKLTNWADAKKFIEATISSFNQHKVINNLPMLYKTIENLLVFYDLTNNRQIFDYLNEFFNKNELNSAEVKLYKDYFYSIQGIKDYTIKIEEWPTKNDIITESIKNRTLFLNGQINFEFLVLNYKRVSELTRGFSLDEVKSLAEGSFSDFIILLSLLIKSGYSEGLFIPHREKIAYLEKVLGKRNIISELIAHLERDLFKLSIKSWEESLEKYTLVSIVPKNFVFRWIAIMILIPTLLFFALRQFWTIGYAYLIVFVIGVLVGGLLVYKIIKNNLKDSSLLKQ
jgi:hypothetical protein